MKRITIAKKLETVETLNKTIANTDEEIEAEINAAKDHIEAANRLSHKRDQQSLRRAEVIEDLQIAEFPEELNLPSVPQVPTIKYPFNYQQASPETT